MVDISFIELGISLFIELFSLSMLIISTIRDVPTTRASSIVRAIYLIPGMIVAGNLIGAGPKFTGLTTLTNSTTISNNGTDIFNATVSEQTNITILNLPVWWEIHLMIFLVLLSYIMIQMVTLFTKTE